MIQGAAGSWSQNLKIAPLDPISLRLTNSFYHVQLVYQTADGATVPTIVVSRRVNTWRMEVEAVSISWGRWRVRFSSPRPTVARAAEVSQSTITKINPPATDEKGLQIVQKVSSVQVYVF